MNFSVELVNCYLIEYMIMLICPVLTYQFLTIHVILS
jgi:hypothetical protein